MIEKIINKITPNVSRGFTKESKLPFEFSNYEKLYQDFVRKVSEGDLANSPVRYIQERNFLQSLIELAKKYGLQTQIEQYSKAQEGILEKLRNFGVGFKE